MKWNDRTDAAKQELERIAVECARLDREHPHQWFWFFADRQHLREIASEVYDVYESEIRVGDRYTKAERPIGMIVPREERDVVILKLG